MPPNCRTREPDQLVSQQEQNRSQSKRFWQMALQNLFCVAVGFRKELRGVAVEEGRVYQVDRLPAERLSGQREGAYRSGCYRLC